MRHLSAEERRQRAVEDLTLQSPHWQRIFAGVMAGIVAMGGCGWGCSALFPSSDFFYTFCAIAGFGVGHLVIFLPLYRKKRRERWIILNGFETEGVITGYKVDGISSSGAGFRRIDNYPVIIATILFTDEEGNERTGYARRTVLRYNLRDLDEMIGRRLVVYWHARYPDQVVPAESRL